MTRKKDGEDNAGPREAMVKTVGPRFRHGEKSMTPLGKSLGARKGISGRVTGIIYKKD